METFSTLLALCAGNSPNTGEFPSQRPVTWSFDVFFDLRRNKWLSKQSRRRWFETPSRSLWDHCNVCTMRSYWYWLLLLNMIRFLPVMQTLWNRSENLLGMMSECDSGGDSDDDDDDDTVTMTMMMRTMMRTITTTTMLVMMTTMTTTTMTTDPVQLK